MTDVTVWFDGACPLCRREIAFMRRLDRRRRIQFIDVSEPTTSCPIDRQQLLERFHASENGQLHSGAAAFGAMWRQIPWLRPLGLAARNRWILAALERAYLLFLRVRPRLTSSRAVALSSLSTTRPNGNWPFSSSSMPKTAHSATSGCEATISSSSPVDRR